MSEIKPHLLRCGCLLVLISEHYWELKILKALVCGGTLFFDVINNC